MVGLKLSLDCKGSEVKCWLELEGKERREKQIIERREREREKQRAPC